MGWLIAIIVVYLLYRFIKKAGEVEPPKQPTIPQIKIKVETSSSYGNRIYQQPEQTKNKSKGRWVQPNETINLKNVSIANGFFYFGGVLEGQNYGGTECSLVDETLTTKDFNYSFTDDSLNYWPRYQGLSPACRGAYINWLASKRDMPNSPIGYVFIYFYGIERRIVVDHKEGKVNQQELKQLCHEIERLRSVFKDNYSFNNYSTNLLEYVAITSPEAYSIPDSQIRNSIYSDVLKYRLAKLAHADSPVYPELAYTWIAEHPDYNLRTPSRRCKKEFKALFIKKYIDRYQEGIKIKPNKTKLRLEYRPASNSLRYFQYYVGDLCDPTVLSAPVKKLAEIALECSDELDSYSRYLGKQDTSRDDLGAIALLPESLIDDFNVPMIEELSNWATEALENHDGIVAFKDLWSLTKQTIPKKLYKKEIELICNLIEKAGFSLAPHPQLHGSKFSVDDKVVIYKINKSDQLQGSVVFDDVAIKLRLGSIVAHADLRIDSKEVAFLEELISLNDNLSSSEKISLQAYLKWLLISPSDFNGLKAGLEKLRDSDTTVVRKILISTALSDGRVVPDEVKEIEKLYVKLGLDKATVPTDIHQFSSNRGAIDRKPVKSQANKSVELDESLLQHLEHETKAAQNILNEIFKDSKEDDESENEAVVPTLENKALEIYRMVADKESVSVSEFEGICSKYGFFVDAAIDSINEWAIDKVAAPVIEYDNEIIIDREIAEELNEIEVLP